MKTIFICLTYLFLSSLNLYSLEPNFTLEVERIIVPDVPQDKNNPYSNTIFAFNCQNVEKKIDTRLIIELMNGDKQTVKTYIDNNGYLTPRIFPQQVFAMCFGCGYGESITLHVESRDYSNETKEPVYYAKVHYVPHPLIEKNKLGVSMSCETIDVRGETFSISLNGLQPNEEVNFDSISTKNSYSFKKTSDSDGNLTFEYSPEIKKNSKNPFRLTASNERIGKLNIRHYGGLEAFTSPTSYVKPKI